MLVKANISTIELTTNKNTRQSTIALCAKILQKLIKCFTCKKIINAITFTPPKYMRTLTDVRSMTPVLPPVLVRYIFCSKYFIIAEIFF